MSNEVKIADYVQRLGDACSIALLHPLCKIFRDPSIDGIIGYREESKCVVVLSSPVCAPNDIPKLTSLFHDYCQKLKKTIIYVTVSHEFTKWALQNSCSSALEFGHEIIIDPTIDTRTGTGPYPHLLRQKQKHAIRNGMVVKEYTGSDLQLEEALKSVATAWLQARKGPQIYVLPLDIFAHREYKRWFYAQKDDQVVGLLMLNRIDCYKGWVLNGGLMLTPEAPTSTSEFLMISALEVLRAEGCKFLSIGPTFAREIGAIEGFGKLSQLLIRGAVKSLQKIFKRGDHQRYWKKFQPRKEPCFVVFAKPRVGIKEIRAVIRSFNVNI